MLPDLWQVLVSLGVFASVRSLPRTVALTGAYVDIWHCNALGVYSDIAAQNSLGRKFLRGYQPTDRQGNAYSLFQTAITLDTRVRAMSAARQGRGRRR